MEDVTVRLRPKTIQFRKNSVIVTESQTEQYKLPYKEIVAAYLQIYDRETGKSYEPEITDITCDMEGDLILCDSQHRRWKIDTALSGRAAGALLEELCVHAPFVMAGGQNWLDLDEETDFEEIKKMVEVRRVCERMG